MASDRSTASSSSVQPGSCRQCGSPTPILPRRKRPAVFCSPECHVAWRRARWIGNHLREGLVPVNSLPPGNVPWNKGVKGIHLSPATEFKKGHTRNQPLPVGTETIRTDQNGKRRAWVKVAEPNKWVLRAVKVWTDANGAAPDGCHIHHIDRDTLNDSLDNLQPLTSAEHLDEHRSEHKSNRKAFCKRGHDLSVTRRVFASGSYCIECSRQLKRERRDRKRAASATLFD